MTLDITNTPTPTRSTPTLMYYVLSSLPLCEQKLAMFRNLYPMRTHTNEGKRKKNDQGLPIRRGKIRNYVEGLTWSRNCTHSTCAQLFFHLRFWNFPLIHFCSHLFFMNSVLFTYPRSAISTNEEVDQRFAQGSSNRSVGAHNINERSSRSHLLLSLKCVGRNLANNSETVG